MEKEPEKGQVWGLLCPQLISHLTTALFDHFLRNISGFKHPRVSSDGSQASPAPMALSRPCLSVPELVLLCSLCLFVTWALFQLLISQVCF